VSTPLTSATSYCSAAEFVKRYDVRSIGDRLGDTGVRVDATSALTDPNLAVLLRQASGMVEEACFRGRRYTPDDLTTLLLSGTPPGTSAGADRLRGLVADLTLWLVYNRRPDPTRPIPSQCQLAHNTLELLATGYRIFSLSEFADAGKEIKVINPTIGEVSPRSSLPLTERANRLFGNLQS